MIALAFAAIAAALHLGTAWRYGYFRDELYFIAASKHLAWGYVDQPPLVAFAAWLSSPFAYNLIALRFLPALAAAATVALAVTIARDFGAGRFGQVLAGAATLLLPAYLLLGNTLTTTSFEPLAWTLTIYACLRLDREPRYWVLVMLAVAFGAYGKYSIALLAVALTAGLLAFRETRGVFRTVWFPVAVVGTVVLVSPNLLWQMHHGWPFVEVLRGDDLHRHAFQNGVALEYRDLAANAVAFAIEQFVYTGPFNAILWIAGLVAPFTIVALRPARFLTVAYAALLFAGALLGAKGYYIIGFYATPIALGSVSIERAADWIRNGTLALVVISGIVAMPLSIPILPVDGLVAYSRALGLTGRSGTPARLIQPVFAEEFGWERLAADVASVYHALPAAQRARAAIYADTYGDAGALDFFGPRFDLPPAISTQNTYYLWGPRNFDGSTLVAIGGTRIDLLRRYYRSVRLVKTSTEPYKWVVEGPAPIYICTLPDQPLAKIWRALRWYGA